MKASVASRNDEKQTVHSDMLSRFFEMMHVEHEEQPAVVCVLAGEWVRNGDGTYTFYDKEDLSP